MKMLYSYIACNKKFYIIFSIIVSLFGAILLFQDRYSFEDEVYANLALSAISDGDFNIANQNLPKGRDWLVTKTGFHPTHVQIASTAYLIPFFLIHKVIAGSSDLIANNFIFANTLAIFSLTIISWVIFFTVLSSIVSRSSALWSMGIILLSTSFFLHFFFSTTAPNMIGAAYSALVFSWFILTPDNEKNAITWLWWGAVSAFGFAIRIQLFWMVLYFSYNLIKEKRKNQLSYFLGILLVSSIYLLNNYVRGGKFVNPYLVFLFNNDFFYFAPRTFLSYLIGPNGLLAVSPIYLIIISATYLILKEKNNSQEKLIKLLLTAPIVLFLTYSTTWILDNYFIGRHQLEYLFIYILIFSLFLDRIKKIPRLYKFIIYLSILFAAWHLYVMFVFLQDVSASGQWHYRYLYFDWNEALKILNGLSTRVDLNIKRIALNFKIALYVFPILLLVAKIAQFILDNRKKCTMVIKPIIAMGMIIYISVSLHGIYKSLTPQPFQKNAVVGNNEFLYCYDDYLEMLRKTMYFYLLRDNCTAVEYLDNLLDGYIANIKEGVVSDPVNFVENLNRGIIRPSNWESDLFIKKLNLERLNRCPRLANHSLYFLSGSEVK